MKEIILLVAAVTWLFHRATRLIKVPAPVLIHILGIDLPEPPRVSVDNVTDQTISIHWKKATGSGSMVVKYIVEVDNVKVGETDRAGSNVTLKNLTPNKRYEIKVLAVNASNYRSHASPIFVHTNLNSDEQLPSTINPLVGITFQTGLKRNRVSSRPSLPSNLSSGPTSNANTGSSTTCSNSVAGNNNSGSSASQLHASRGGTGAGAHHAKSKDPNTDKYYTIENLTHEVEGIQEEITELLGQSAAAEEEFLGAESVLITELEALKTRRRLDDQQRAGTRSEAKNLEESKRILETQRSKLDKKAHSLEAELEKRRTRQETWHQEIAEARFKIGQLEQALEQLNEESCRDIENVKGMIESCRSDIVQLEDQIKALIASVKKAEVSKQATTKALEEFRNMIDPVTLILADENADLKALTTQENVDDYFAEWLDCEMKIDQSLEDEWKRAQKDLEMRYLKVHDQYEKARLQNNANNASQTRNAPGPANNVSANKTGAQLQPAPTFVSAAGYQMSTASGSGVGSSASSSFIQPPSATAANLPLGLTSSVTSMTPAASTSGFLGLATTSAASATNTAKSSLSISGMNTSSSSPIARGTATFHDVLADGGAENTTDDESDSIPPANALLPSNLFGKDDLTESFATFFKKDGPLEPDTALAPVTTGRSLLFSDAVSTYSNSSLRVLSPKQSLLFGRTADNDTEPLSSPPSVNLFPNTSIGSSIKPVINVPEPLEAGGTGSPDAKKKDKTTGLNRKFSTRFFFGGSRTAPRESSLSNNVDLISDDNDVDGSFLTSSTTANSNGNGVNTSNGFSMDEMLLKPRAGSFSSALSSKTPSINPNDAFFNTWRDTSAMDDPWASPTETWQTSSPPQKESKDRTKTPKKQKKQKPTGSGSDSVPQFLYSPTKLGKSGFKGIAGLFERSPGAALATSPATNMPVAGDVGVTSGSAADNGSLPVPVIVPGEKSSKSIASLFRKTDDDMLAVETPVPLQREDSGSSTTSHHLQKNPSSEPASSLVNSVSSAVSSTETGTSPTAVFTAPASKDKDSANFLQKSMRRSFVGRRSTSTTSSSSKFVRKLSIFGKKNDPRDDDILFEGDADGFTGTEDGEADLDAVDDLEADDGEAITTDSEMHGLSDSQTAHSRE